MKEVNGHQPNPWPGLPAAGSNYSAGRKTVYEDNQDATLKDNTIQYQLIVAPGMI